VTNPSKEQLDKVLVMAEKEHHAILFLYKADMQKYGKLLEVMGILNSRIKILSLRQCPTGARY